MSDHQQRYVLAFDNFDFNQDHIDYFDTEVQYFPKKRRLESTQQNFRYQGRAIKNIFSWSYELDSRFFDLQMDMQKNEASILSFVFIPVKSIQNEGRLRFSLSGPLDNMSVNFSEIYLNQFKLTFDESRSFLNSSIMVDRDKLNVKYGRIDFDSMGFYWQGVDTFRRVTRSQKRISLSWMVQLIFKK